MDTIELLFFLGYPNVFYPPTILMDTIELLFFLGYPKVFYPPTILMDTIELLFFLGYPKVFYPPTILMDTIELLFFLGYWRFFQQIFYKENNAVRANPITSLHYNISTALILPHYTLLTTIIYFI